MANEANLKPFKKGDPRINRKGRPKSFNGLRELARMIADEKAKAGGKTLIIDGHTVTVVEAIIRSWAMGKDKKKQQAFIEIAYGKVPDRIEHEMIKPVLVEHVLIHDEQEEEDEDTSTG